MTHPAEDTPEGSGVTGSLAAASQEDKAAGDPLGPLNEVTDDLSSDDDDLDSDENRRGPYPDAPQGSRARGGSS